MLCVLCRVFRRWVDELAPDCADVHDVLQASAWPSDGLAPWGTLEQQERQHRAYAVWDTDPPAALRECVALAEEGSVWGMIAAGQGIASGHGAPVDGAQAETWFRRAHEHGSKAALLHLAHLYYERREFARAEAVLLPAVEQGFAPAMYHLACVHLKGAETGAPEPARVLLERAAALGSLAAEHRLAMLMMKGRLGWRSIPTGWRLARAVAGKAMAELAREAKIDPGSAAEPAKLVASALPHPV